MKTNALLLLTIFGLIILTSYSFPDEYESHKQYVKQYFHHFNAHDWESMANMYSEEALFKSPTLGFGIHERSREEIIQEYTELSSIIPDIKDSVVSIYPAGKNNVVIEFISTGTDPSGEKFILPICTIFKIEDGLITSDFTYYDNF